MAFSVSLESQLALTHTIAIKWKENYDAVLVDYHHSLCLCGDKMKLSLPKKNNFFFIYLFFFFGGGGRLPLLPGSH